MREKNDGGTTRYYYDGNDIWGNPTVKEEADQYTNPFRYSGEYWDEGQQLQYLRARWYDPSGEVPGILVFAGVGAAVKAISNGVIAYYNDENIFAAAAGGLVEGAITGVAAPTANLSDAVTAVFDAF